MTIPIPLHNLDASIRNLCGRAFRQCHILLPAQAAHLVHLPDVREIAQNDPRVCFHFYYSCRLSEPGIESLDLTPLMHMAHVRVYALEGEYDGIIANENQSLVLPGSGYPGITVQAYPGKLGWSDFPDLKTATKQARLLFSRKPVYQKKWMGLQRRYVGSKTIRNQLCFTV